MTEQYLSHRARLWRVPEDRIAALLDEPTLGLDPIVRSELWEMIRALGASFREVVEEVVQAETV